MGSLGMDVQAALEAAKTFVMQNPTVVLVVVFVIYRIYRALYPVPFPEDVPGSKVKSLASMKDFDALFDTSEKAKRKLVVVDYYATWCPPCKAAAPIYGAMSKSYSEDVASFYKVNVDSAKDVARAHGISAMPTFKVFESNTKKELESIRGWNEAKLRTAIDTLSKTKAS